MEWWYKTAFSDVEADKVVKSKDVKNLHVRCGVASNTPTPSPPEQQRLATIIVLFANKAERHVQVVRLVVVVL
jgi:hypothetical protein